MAPGSQSTVEVLLNARNNAQQAFAEFSKSVTDITTALLQSADASKSVTESQQKASAATDVSTTSTKALTEAVNETAQAHDSLRDILGPFISKYLEARTIFDLARTAYEDYTNFLQSSISAYGDAEQAQVRLGAALQIQGTATPAITSQYKAFAEQLTNTTTVSKTAAEQAEATFAIIGNVGPDQMQRALKAAADYSAATGKSFESATLAIAKASEGQVGALTRYGISLTKAQVQTEGMSVVFDAVESKMHGMSEAMTGTLIGSWDQLNNRWTVAKENLGEELAPALETGIKLLSGLVEVIAQSPGAFTTLALASGALAAALAWMGAASLWGDQISRLAALVSGPLTQSFTLAGDAALVTDGSILKLSAAETTLSETSVLAGGSVLGLSEAAGTATVATDGATVATGLLTSATGLLSLAIGAMIVIPFSIIVGEWIGKVTGLTDAIQHWAGASGDAALKAQTLGAQQDVINKAISEGAPSTITYGDAVKYVDEQYQKLIAHTPQVLQGSKEFQAAIQQGTAALKSQQILTDAIADEQGKIASQLSNIGIDSLTQAMGLLHTNTVTSLAAFADWAKQVGLSSDAISFLREQVTAHDKAVKAATTSATKMATATEAGIARATQLWDEYFQFTDKAGADSLAAALEGNQRWYDGKLATLEKGKKLDQDYENELTALTATKDAKDEAARTAAAAKRDAQLQASLDKEAGYWDDYYKTTDADQQNSLQEQLDAVDTWYDKQYAALSKSAEKNPELWNALASLNADYYAKLTKASDDWSIKEQSALAQTENLWDQYYATINDTGGKTVQTQIAAVDLWRQRTEESLKVTDLDYQNHYNAIEALAVAKTQAIIAANDPIAQAWKGLNADLGKTWADTWTKALETQQGFVAAILSPFTQLEHEWLSVLGAMVADYENQFIAKLTGINLAPGLGASGVSGSPGGGLLSSLLGRSAGGNSSFNAQGLFTGASTVTSNMTVEGVEQGGIAGVDALADLGSQGAEAAASSAATATTTMASSLMTAGIGAIIAIGAPLLVSGLKKLFGGVSQEEKDARTEAGNYEQSLDSLLTATEKAEAGGVQWKETNIAVRDAYLSVGLSADDAMAAVQRVNDATHQSPAAVKAATDAIDAVMAHAKQKASDVSTAVDAIASAAQAAGGTVPAALQPMIAKLLTMQGLTDDEKTKLQGLTQAVTPDFKNLETIASNYGITLAGLGPKFQQGDLEASAKTLFGDFTALTGAGADVGGVLLGMSGKINDLVKESIQFGTAIPNNMQPLIQNLIDAGKLTDENGQKLTDITKIKFEDTPLDAGTNAIVTAIDKLGQLLSGLPGIAQTAADGIGGALSNVHPPPIDVPIRFDTPDVPTDNQASSGGYVGYGRILHFATGGLVPPGYFANGGPVGTDTVNAWLTPKESVLTVGATDTLGLPTIAALNHGASLDTALQADPRAAQSGASGGGTHTIVAPVIVMTRQGASPEEIVEQVIDALPDSILRGNAGLRSRLRSAIGLPVTTWTAA